MCFWIIGLLVVYAAGVIDHLLLAYNGVRLLRRHYPWVKWTWLEALTWPFWWVVDRVARW